LKKVRETLWRLAPIGLSLILLVLAIVATIAEPTAMTTLRNAAFDSYQRLRPRQYEPVAARVIDIDDESLERVGQWPWSRTTLAKLIERLDAHGVRAIGLDIVLAEPDRSSPEEALKPWLDSEPLASELVARLPQYDDVLARQIGASRVVTGFVLNNDAGSPRLPLDHGRFVLAGDPPTAFIPSFEGAVPSLPAFESAASGNGALNTIPGSDGVVRRLQLLVGRGETVHPVLATEVLRVAEDADNYVIKSSGASGESRFGGRTGIVNVRIGSIPVATDAQGGIWLHYSEPVEERTIAAWRILEGEVQEGALDGGVVIVGTSAAGLKDLRLNSLGRETAGAQVHVQAIEQILQDTYLTRPDWATACEILFMVAMWVLLVSLILRFGALPAAVMGLAATATAYLGSWLAFSQFRLLLDPTFASLTALSVYMVCSVAQHWRAERDRRWIHQAFSSYISPNLVQHLIDHPRDLGLRGERRECSFVMTDLESFTALVEQSEPSLIVELLNEYLDGVVKVVFAHEGTLDRIVGDAVAVMFSAPAVQSDHAARAVACALEIDTFARAFAAAKRDQGISIGRTRIGVNTGWVTVGNVGSERIVDYRALGDAVNAAARLETVNGKLGTTVCVSGTTVAACPGFSGRPAGMLVLKGKSEAVAAFEPLAAEVLASPGMVQYLEAYALLDDEQKSARAAFERLHETFPEDPLAAFHLARLEAGESGTLVVLAGK